MQTKFYIQVAFESHYANSICNHTQKLSMARLQKAGVPSLFFSRRHAYKTYHTIPCRARNIKGVRTKHQYPFFLLFSRLTRFMPGVFFCGVCFFYSVISLFNELFRSRKYLRNRNAAEARMRYAASYRYVDKRNCRKMRLSEYQPLLGKV